jgi:hypothetical protein
MALDPEVNDFEAQAAEEEAGDVKRCRGEDAQNRSHWRSAGGECSLPEAARRPVSGVY